MNLVKKIILESIATPAKIAKADNVSEHFRVIELEAETLKKVQWQPGTKVGIILNGNQRVYTPVSIDAATGRMKLLIYIHGKGVGSTWAAAAKAAAECQFVGPRHSLDLSALSGPTVLFGDETSFAVAGALKSHLGSRVNVGFVFEVCCESEARMALKSVDIENATLFERLPNAAHLKQVTAEVSKLVADLGSRDLVLTGCGPSLQSLRASLGDGVISRAKGKTKAYWAPGKLGLD